MHVRTQWICKCRNDSRLSFSLASLVYSSRSRQQFVAGSETSLCPAMNVEWYYVVLWKLISRKNKKMPVGGRRVHFHVLNDRRCSVLSHTHTDTEAGLVFILLTVNHCCVKSSPSFTQATFQLFGAMIHHIAIASRQFEIRRCLVLRFQNDAFNCYRCDGTM